MENREKERERGLETAVAETAPETRGNGKPHPFRDNLDCLQSLREEARLLLRLALARKAGDDHEGCFFSHDALMDFMQEREPAAPVTQMEETFDDKHVEQMERGLKWLRAWNGERAALSELNGTSMAFYELVKTWDFDEFERGVVLVLFMKEFDRNCGNLFKKIEPEWRGNGAWIGTLLEILSDGFASQLKNRAYFGSRGKLQTSQILVSQLNGFDDDDNILGEAVCLHQRIANYIIGDNTVYNPSMNCIRREEPAACLGDVILPESLTAPILEQVEVFRDSPEKDSETQKAPLLKDESFGCGKGLAMLFYGPSGTGKTMLAHALAKHAGLSLISVDFGRMSVLHRRMSSQDLVEFAFREAKLTGAAVFFDECDDVFNEESGESGALLKEIEKADCMTILATNQPERLDPALDRRLHLKIAFPLPDESLRKKLWRRMTENAGYALNEAEAASLSKSFVFTGGIIRNAVLAAKNIAVHRNEDLSFEHLKEAGDIQADSLFDRTGLIKARRPKETDCLRRFPRPFREAMEKLAVSSKNALNADASAAALIRCRDVETGMELGEHVSFSCGVRVRVFDLRDVLRLRPCETEAREAKGLFPAAPFKRQQGHRSVSVIVDRYGDLDRYFMEDDREKNSLAGELADCFKASSEVVFLVTNEENRTGGKRMAISFDAVLRVPFPPVLAQADEWRRLAGEETLSEDEATELAEALPMHFREISEAVRAVLFEQGGNLGSEGGFAQAAKAHLQKERRSAPVLFGKGRTI